MAIKMAISTFVKEESRSRSIKKLFRMSFSAKYVPDYAQHRFKVVLVVEGRSKVVQSRLKIIIEDALEIVSKLLPKDIQDYLNVSFKSLKLFQRDGHWTSFSLHVLPKFLWTFSPHGRCKVVQKLVRHVTSGFMFVQRSSSSERRSRAFSFSVWNFSFHYLHTGVCVFAPSISPACSQHILLQGSLEEFFPPTFHWPATLIFQFLPISVCLPWVWDLSVRFMFVSTPPSFASVIPLHFSFRISRFSRFFFSSLSLSALEHSLFQLVAFISSLLASLLFKSVASPSSTPSLPFNFIRDYFSSN